MHHPFYSPALGRENLVPSSESEVARQAVIELLGSGKLAEEVAMGNITLAMIRPSLEGACLDDWADSEAVDLIEENIQGLGMKTKFSATFDREAVELFYAGGPKEIQTNLPPERFGHYDNRWEEFVALMLSGPTTMYLLHSPNGDAVSTWRQQVGHFDILAKRNPSTLRGRFGKDNYNNLIHGSDSHESVLREIGIVISLLARA